MSDYEIDFNKPLSKFVKCYYLPESNGFLNLKNQKLAKASAGYENDFYAKSDGIYCNKVDYGYLTDNSTFSDNEFTAIVELNVSSLVNSSESIFIRVDAVFSLGIFFNTKTVRCLLKTDGTTGWTTAVDFIESSIEVGKDICLAFSYKNGNGMKMFVNGVQASSYAATGNIVFQSYALTLMGSTYPAAPLSSQFATKKYAILFNKQLSSSEVKSISENPQQLLKHIRTVANDSWYATLFPALGGLSAIINTALEINNAQSLSKSKVKTLSQAIETNLSYQLSTSLSAIVNQAQETDTVNALLKAKSKLISQTIETNNANGLSKQKSKTINTALESDSALSVLKTKVKTIAQAIETNFSNTISTGIVALINRVSESNTATQLSKSKLKTINQASEINTANTLINVKIKQIGIVSETDLALNLNKTKTVTINSAIETDNAIALLTNQVINVGQALEADVALSISIAGAVTTIHPKRIFIVDAKDRVYSVEPKNRSYMVD